MCRYLRHFVDKSDFKVLLSIKNYYAKLSVSILTLLINCARAPKQRVILVFFYFRQIILAGSTVYNQYDNRTRPLTSDECITI